MLSDQRQECLKQIQWSRVLPDTISVLECWKSDGLVEPVRDQDYRFLRLSDSGDDEKIRSTDSSGEEVERWLKWQDPYCPLPPSGNAVTLSGGIRLFLCERLETMPSMSISQKTYLSIEEEFCLHSTTLPSFSTMNGTYGLFIDPPSTKSTPPSNIRMVVKMPQKTEIGNSTLSLCYNVSTGWTNAFICGQRLLNKSSHDQAYGSQLKQLINAIIAEPGLWDNPLFLPSILLQNCAYRLQLRSHAINDILTGLESEIGVTFAGKARYTRDRYKWPQDVDPKITTVHLHSVFTQILYLSSCCQWAKDYASYLLKVAPRLEAIALTTNSHFSVQEVSQIIEYLLNTSETTQTRYLNFKDRANVQTNVLFNIISQQATILNRRDMQLSFRIAKASKEDSISMTTFTFLTALYLPGTFIAAMFSMGMFDWQKNNGASNENATPLKGQSYVSSNYWIYWAVTLPLTLATMSSWYVWSRYANKKWLEELNNVTIVKEQESGLTSKPDIG